MMKRSSILYKMNFICMVILFLLTGCTKPKVQNEIIIGVAWPFEKNNNLFSQGIDLAVEQINTSGGINGQKLSLLKEDDESDVVKGMTIAQSFAENKKISAVIGHRNSFISIPASEIYDNAGLVMLSPASTSPKLTQNRYTHIFRNIAGDDEIAKHLTSYLAKKGHKRMVIYYSDDSYGTELADCFESYAKADGITIVDRFNCYLSIGDLLRLNTRWQAFGADGIFIANTLSDGGRFISDAGKAGIKLPLFAGNALDSDLLSDIGGKNAEGTIISSVFDPSSEREEVKKFISAFQNKYNEIPGPYAALGYDSVNILAAAMKKNGSWNRTAIADGIVDLGKWSGVTGIHEFDKNGNDLGDLVVLKEFVSGEFKCLSN